jgi:hypothetical protein
MKQTGLIGLLLIFLLSCANYEPHEQDLYNKIKRQHDSSMKINAQLLKNQAELEALLNTTIQASAKDSAILLKRDIQTANDGMAEWMKLFKPRYQQKTHGETMLYLKDKQSGLRSVDSLTQIAISASRQFILKHKK